MKTERITCRHGWGFTAALLILFVFVLLPLTASAAEEGAEAADSHSGWVESDGTWYYYLSDGSPAAGWKHLEDGWYYFDPETGAAHSGWLEIDSGWYYLNADDQLMRTGWLNLSDRWYYFGDNGRMVTGWRKIAGDWYYFDPETGTTHSGWLETDGGWYYLNPDDDIMHTGWFNQGGRWYYFDQSGRMVTGWREVGGKWYYFDPESGVAYRSGWKLKDDGSWFYFDSDADALTGWKSFGSKWYYFQADGTMTTGWCEIGEKWYYFDTNTGAAYVSGWKLMDGNYWFYFDDEAEPLTGWQKFGNNWYYFLEDGMMATGWVFEPADGDWHYFYKKNDSSGQWGAMAHDVTIEGFEIPSNGGIPGAAKNYMKTAAGWCTSSTPYLILVDTEECTVGIFTGSDYNWDLLYYWQCAPGAPETPTVTGYFTVGSRGTYFDSGSYRCHYYTQFYGNYLFHSVLYDHYGNLADSRVGMQLSHGCVRLSIDRAYWIYSTIPSGTTVYVY